MMRRAITTAAIIGLIIGANPLAGQAQLTVSPASVDFGVVPVGESVSDYLILTDMEQSAVKQLIPGSESFQFLLLQQTERERDSSTTSQSDIRGLRPESQSRMTVLRRERDAL